MYALALSSVNIIDSSHAGRPCVELERFLAQLYAVGLPRLVAGGGQMRLARMMPVIVRCVVQLSTRIATAAEALDTDQIDRQVTGGA